MKLPNCFICVFAVWIVLIVAGCHSGNNGGQTNRQPKMEPPLPMPYFNASDTLIKAKPADTGMYSIIKAILVKPNLVENTRPTRFCEVTLVDSRFTFYFDEPIRKKLISASDTTGFKTPDTSHYQLDWGKIDDRKGISVKEVAHGISQIIHSGAMEPTPYPLQLKAGCIKYFHCQVLACVSYPRLNKSGNLAIVEMAESFHIDDSGSCFYFLKKIKGKWKLIYIQSGWMT